MKNIKYGLVAALTMAAFVPAPMLTAPVSASVPDYCSSSYDTSSVAFTKGTAMEAADTAWETAEGYADAIANATFGQDLSSARTALYGYESTGYTLSGTSAYDAAATAEAEAIDELDDIIDDANYKDLAEMKDDINTYITNKVTSLTDAVNNLTSEITSLESYASGFGVSHATEIATIVEALTATKTTLNTQLATYNAYDLDTVITTKTAAAVNECAGIDTFTITQDSTDNEIADGDYVYIEDYTTPETFTLEAEATENTATIEYSVADTDGDITAEIEGTTLTIDASALEARSSESAPISVTATVKESGDSETITFTVTSTHYGETETPVLTDADGETSFTVTEGANEDLTIETGLSISDGTLLQGILIVDGDKADMTLDELYDVDEDEIEDSILTWGEDFSTNWDDDVYSEWLIGAYDVSASSADDDFTITVSGDYLSALSAGEYTIMAVFSQWNTDPGVALATASLTVESNVDAPDTGVNTAAHEGAIASTSATVAGVAAATVAGAAVVARKQMRK